MPAVLFVLDRNDAGEPGVLALEWLAGVPLGGIRLSQRDRDRLEERIAGAVSALHRHTRPSFGDVAGPGSDRWLDVFGPRLSHMVEECAGRTDSAVVAACRQIVARLEELFAGREAPATLVHGDLWANNILVDPDAPGGVALKGFIDPGAQYADPEYETAYLEVFQTVGRRFFEVYRREHPAAPGYPVRRAVYHLHTMLVHIWYFGDAVYHRRAAELARELSSC